MSLAICNYKLHSLVLVWSTHDLVQNSLKSRPTVSPVSFSRAGCFCKCLYWKIKKKNSLAGIFISCHCVNHYLLRGPLVKDWCVAENLGHQLCRSALYVQCREAGQAHVACSCRQSRGFRHGSAPLQWEPLHTCHTSKSALLTGKIYSGWEAGQAVHQGLQIWHCMLSARGLCAHCGNHLGEALLAPASKPVFHIILSK